MGARLFQYRTVEAAWHTIWLPWLRDHADILNSGKPALFVVDHAQQIGWLKHRALAEGISLCGIEWLTAAGLRRWLAKYLGVPFDPFGRENLELILRLEGPEDGPLARGPREALAALDELGRAGWTGASAESKASGGTDGFNDPLLARGADALVQSGGWTPALEAAMLRASRAVCPAAIPVLVAGWGSGHCGDGRLLALTARLTGELIVTVPTPRFLGGEDADACWISWLEAQLKSEMEMCPEPGEEGPYQDFVDSLVVESGEKDVVLPGIQIGYDPSDQVRQVIDWLADFPFQQAGEGNIACIVPGERESLTLLGDALARAGIPAHQEVGETASSGSFQMFHQLLTRLLKSQGDIEVVLDLLEWLIARGETRFKSLRMECLRSMAVEHFKSFQHRSLSRWQEALNAADSPEEQMLTHLSQWLPGWDGQATWEQWRERYRAITGHFGFTTDYLEPVWSRMNPVLEGRVLPAAFFLDYISSLLEVPGQWRPDELDQPLARLRLTTPEMAAGRTWAGWIWLDAHEGAWPGEIRENPFLPDARKREWNRQMNRQQKLEGGCAPLLTGADRAALKRRLVLDLLENTTGPVCFSGSLTEGSAPELTTYPNEWVAQILLHSGLDEKEALARWTAHRPTGVDPIGCAVADLPPPQRVVEVVAARRNPESAPGDFEFVFGAVAGEGEVPSISASAAERFLQHPAQWFLEKRMEAVPRKSADFCRSDGLLLGNWTHESLKEILQAQRGQSPAEPGEWSPGPEETTNGEADLRLVLLREKSRWMVRSCLQQLVEHFGDAIIEGVEFSPPRQVIETPYGSLELRGKVDLLLREAGGRLCVIDFKTGSTGGIPTPYKLGKDGEGLQYAVYLRLLAEGQPESASDPDIAARVVQPLGGSDRELNPEQARAADPHWAQMRRMFSEGCFPLRSTARSGYGGGGVVLPLSTLPIAQAVLDAKWELISAEVNP